MNDDWCWSSGARSGKATALYLEKRFSDDESFSPEIANLLFEACEDLERSKITQLEIENRLVLSRFLIPFPEH